MIWIARRKARKARGIVAGVWLVLLVLMLLALPLLLSVFRSTELVVLEYKARRLHVERGRLPHELFNDLEDVLTRARAERASLKIVREGGRARLSTTGVDDDTEQRLRNVVGRFPLATIRSGQRRGVR